MKMLTMKVTPNTLLEIVQIEGWGSINSTLDIVQN